MTVTRATARARARAAKAPFGAVVFMCGKCRRKLGAKGKSMRKALRAALKHRPVGKVRLIETRCFSLCPKGRIVVASAQTLGEGRLLVLEPGSCADRTVHALLASTLLPPA